MKIYCSCSEIISGPIDSTLRKFRKHHKKHKIKRISATAAEQKELLRLRPSELLDKSFLIAYI